MHSGYCEAIQLKVIQYKGDNMLRKLIIIGFYLLSTITVYSTDLDNKISEYIKNGQFSTAMKYLNELDSFKEKNRTIEETKNDKHNKSVKILRY